MAGQEVTFDDVARAAESLQKDGEAVTIEAVQDFLAEGSPNAIFKHLAAWRAANVKPKKAPKAELPKELLAGLADWALKFAEESGAGDREALERNEADIEALRSAGEALEGERDALREEMANATAASEEAIAERDETIERLNAELKNARQEARCLKMAFGEPSPRKSCTASMVTASPSSCKLAAARATSSNVTSWPAIRY